MTRRYFGGFASAAEPYGFGQSWTGGPGFGSHPGWGTGMPWRSASGPWLYEHGFPPVGRHRGKGPKGYLRSDSRIAEDVVIALTNDPLVDASDVEVIVSSGDVTLSGSVPERWMRRSAARIAEDCLGVRDVFNRIRVDEPAWRESAAWWGETREARRRSSASVS